MSNKNLASDSGRILTFAVFSRNKKLAEKIIGNAQRYDTHDFVCGIANAILDIKAGLAQIDPYLCEELEGLCKNFPTWYKCEECEDEWK